MNFIKKSIGAKIVVICILTAILICSTICVSGYFEYRNAIYKDYQTFAYNLADVAASYVDGDTVTNCLENGGTDPEYTYMTENFYKLYKNSGIHAVYVAIPDKNNLVDGKPSLTNVFDVRIIDAAEENKKYFEIGVVDPIGVEHPEYILDVFYTGEENTEDFFVTESEFGYNMNAVIAIKNSKGESQAILVVAVPMLDIQSTLNRFVFTTIIITAAIIVLCIGVFLILLNKTISRPIKLISSEADNFVKSDAKISDKLTKIKQIDEIGNLANSIYKMETDINTYIENITSITAEKERIGAELDVAAHIQLSMLPCIFPAFPDREEFDIYATMVPAKEVGGDFYDFFMIDETHLAIVVADVSGKGVPAALFMVIGKTLIKDHTQTGKDLGSVFTTVNNMLCDANSEGLFITAFEGVIDLVTGEFNFVNAGHEMPCICKANGSYEAYKTKPGFVLAGMEDMRYKGGSIILEPGDKIFQYTDGVTEATNAKNQLFGMDRMLESLNNNKDLTPEQLLPAVKKDIDAFVGEVPQFDDITMLCLEYKKKMDAEKKVNTEE